MISKTLISVINVFGCFKNPTTLVTTHTLKKGHLPTHSCVHVNVAEGRKWVSKCLKVAAAGVWLSVRWPGVSALRYIRLNSLRSQPVMPRHAHIRIHGLSCQRGVWAMLGFRIALTPRMARMVPMVRMVRSSCAMWQKN